MLTRRSGLSAALAALASPAFAASPPGPASIADECETTRTTHGLPAFAAAAIVKGEIVAAGAAGVRAIGRSERVTLAGAMIEKVAGASWEELITARIFAPLGLKTAGLGPQATTGSWDAPVGHQVDDKGAPTPMPWGPAGDVPPVIGPAGVAHMSVLDFVRWAGWNAGMGKRGPALVTPQTLADIHRPRISTGRLSNAAPGTPQEGQYAICWGVLKFDWAKQPLLQHSGSNSMNLAKVLVDTPADIGVVVMTNYPGKQADAATNAMMEKLYRRYAGT